MKHFASLPTQHRLSLDELHTHEYFGNDFVAGTLEPALFCTDELRKHGEGVKTSYRVVWTYGKWDSFGLAKYDEVEFFHTQTMARRNFRFVRVLGLNEKKTNKISQWTLK